MKKIIASCLMFLSVFTAFAQGEPNDCVNAITVCGNGTFVSNANGIGQVQEVTGCGGFENNSIWIKINIVQAGNLGFDLVPDDTDINVDYDFWVYSANAQCGSLGAPIRCCTTNPVMAGLTNNHTGMNGNTLITQSGPGADGDGYVRWLTVSPGQSYYIVIDRPIGDGGFSINWTGTATFGDGAFPQAPDANQLDEVRTCSNNPNVGVFDLGALKPQINSDTTNNTIEFFTSAANAVDGTSPLSDIISNTSNPQQIYAKVTDNTTGCSSITDFTIAVYPLPNITVTASPQDACPGADVTVTFTGPANANFNYNVDGGAPQSATLDANGSFTITQGYMQDTTYTLEDANITTSDGTVVCSQSLSASVTINVNDMEPLVFTTNGPVCSDDDGVITLTGPANATVNYTIASNPSQTITLDGTGQGIITLPALTATTDFIIIDVTDAQAPFCTVTLNETGTLEVTGAPVLTEPEPMHECIDGNTGVASFDLESNNDAITGGGTFVVTYHMSQADADNDTGAIASPYQSALANQTLFVRVELGSGASCVSFTTIDLIATNAPTVTAPAPQVVCDDNADGLMQFDLTSTINVITGNNASYQVSFFISQTDADADTSVITNPEAYTNTVPGGQTIFARVVDPANTVCYATTSFDLVVNPSPQVPPVISDYELCDFDGDNVEVFDLTTRAAEIGSFTLSYYTSLADAATPANAIVDPANYQSGGEPVYVRSENANGCFSVTTFNTVVNILPVINNPAPVFAGCEEVSGQADFVLHNHDTAVTGGQSGMTVRYFATQGAAEIGDPADELPAVYVSPTTNIYARVTATATGCWVVITVPLEVIQAPIGENPDALEECDLNGDGSAKFNLQAVLDDLETQMPGVIATAHETQDDADMATNAITETTEYIYLPVTNPSGIIYIRLQSGQTECYDVIELQLIVHPVPEATTPAAYGLCDNGLDDSDGEGIFDLTTVESEVLGLLDPAQYSVSYHESAQDAADNASPIVTPGNYTSTGGMVYIRVTNNATGCYDVVELELIVHPLPQANQPTPYTLCDENTVNGQPDETEVFDLTSKTEEIIGTQDGINLTFHHTLADAEAGTNAIANPEAYTNQSTVEAIYVRVTFEATDCYRIVLLDIRVAPLPVLVPPSAEDLLVCDPDGDGFAQFDLEALVEDMVDNGEDLLVTFHETAIDAESGLNPIPNPDNYTNNVAYAQTIYVRVENTVTGCYTSTAYALDLVVVDAPQLPDLEDITLCDEDNNDQDGVTAIDLTIHDAIILDALDGTDADYTIHYFTTEAAAEAGAPRITNDTAYNGADGQVIWVRVEDIATGCYSIASFTLHVNTPLALTTPPVLTICNEALPNDGQAEFDLTVMDNTILGPFGVGLGYTVNYYEPGAATPIANPSSYVNPSNPLTLTVEVITLEGCKSYTTLTIRVLPLPTPNTEPDALVLCDDNGNGDGVEEFDLTLAADDIMDNEPNLVLSYHETYEDADQDINPIADPTAYESGNAIVYVRVEANTGNPNDAVCYQIVELELIVNPLPALGDGGTIPPYAICEQNTDGFATFILSSHIPEILQGADQDPADYLVRFYFDQAALDAGTALPNQYTNQVQTNQTILVWVQHIESGCIITADLELYVEEAAIANAPADPVLSTCDDDGDNDGMHEFDLSVFDAEILGTQDPTEYSVAYYETIEDAESATNAIPDPSVYVNSTSDVMTIYARVTNDATISGCHDITEITLIVERLPEPVITSADGSDTICVDYTNGDVLRTVTLNSGIPADMGYSFIWYLNGTELTDYDPASPSYEASAAGDYTVEVTGPAPLNCVSDISAAFTVIQSGPASPVGNGYEVTNYFSDNQVITVYVEGHGEYEYRLDEDGMWQTSNVFTDVPAGTHTVYVRDVKTDYACDEIAIEGVSLVDYPHYFTPNGDGYHDTWNIIGLNQPDAKVYIFDRFGKLIKQISATDESEGWDGTYNGNPLPATDYWFSVTYRELVNGEPVEKEFKAHFSLKR